MNRRQKMKKIKQELEWYKKQLVPFKIETRQMQVETLCANHFYNKDMVDYVREIDPQSVVEMFREDIIDQLEPYLEDCIQFECIHLKDVPNTYEVIGKLKVVVPHGGDGF